MLTTSRSEQEKTFVGLGPTSSASSPKLTREGSHLFSLGKEGLKRTHTSSQYPPKKNRDTSFLYENAEMRTWQSDVSEPH